MTSFLDLMMSGDWEEQVAQNGTFMKLLLTYYNYMRPTWKDLSFRITQSPSTARAARHEWTCEASLVWVVEDLEILISESSVGPQYSKQKSKEDAARRLYETATSYRHYYEWDIFDDYDSSDLALDPRFKTCWL